MDEIGYIKRRTALRYWLHGMGFHQALKAMEFAGGFHTGKRKGGEPEFSHQIWQANFTRTIAPSLLHPEEQICVAFLHDVVEDYPVKVSQIEAEFGEMIAGAVERISKVVEGTKKDTATYFQEMIGCPIASLAKGIDRMHNHQTMVGVFTKEKQCCYIAETEDFILPMLRKARRIHTRQEPAFENVKHSLTTQIQLIRLFLDA